MKVITLSCGLFFLLAVGVSNTALAQHDHFHSGHFHSEHFHSGHFHHGPHVGVVIGGPLWWPWPEPVYGPYYGYYPYPPVVAVPAQPPVYIEQSQPGAAPSGYWYYCHQADGYYPYVKQCPGGWQQVPPLPPGNR